ncbi:MAG: hypothetical protein QOI37_942 [Chloroflexota bacterium]|nr:hypothetical protein [Chloroflexota bacterium]MEA2653715.1 hypothetical protein [Chloroflexota bacterium]
MHSTVRKLRIQMTAGFIGLTILVIACTSPTGGGTSPALSPAPSGGAATAAPSISTSAAPTKAGY